MIKHLLLAAALVASSAWGDEKIHEKVETGVRCIGGYMHSYALYGNIYQGGVSIQQIFSRSKRDDLPPQPIKCEDSK